MMLSRFWKRVVRSRLKNDVKHGEIVKAIEHAFDEAFYLETNIDVADAGVNAVEHYVLQGEAEGRRPTKQFDPAEFSRKTGITFSDRDSLFRAFLEEFYGDHSLLETPVDSIQISETAIKEIVKAIKPAFDVTHYLNANKDVLDAKIDPIEHYVLQGEAEGRRPTKQFDPAEFSRKTGIAFSAQNNLFKAFLEEFDGDYSLFEQANSNSYSVTGEIANQADDIRPHFDEEHYRTQVSAKDIGGDVVVHYLLFGEKQGLTPNTKFDPKFYLATNQDLAAANISPFWHYVKHGRAEQRSPCSYLNLREPIPFIVSVIVPNYNHALFLEERLNSILNQSYKRIELIVLDDCSTDESIDVIEGVKRTASIPIRTYYNKKNSGNVFRQWKKGLEHATGDLVWICESDDTCDPHFLERIVKHFNDESVMLAFGAIQFCDSSGQLMEGMDGYRESAWPGMWNKPFKRPAANWFHRCLGTKNVISNVGGCVFRHFDLRPETWEKAQTFKIAGDWFLYSEIAGGGAIAYEPTAIAYFRQHGKNKSASNFHQDYYYREHEAIGLHLTQMYGLPHETRLRFVDKIKSEYKQNGGSDQGFLFSDVFDEDKVLLQEQTRRHFQIGSMGFQTGGGEVFPIVVANALRDRGHLVSMACTNLIDIEPQIRNQLDRSIPVYDASDIPLEGTMKYVHRRNIDLFNSHNMQVDSMAFRYDAPFPAAYVPTLHGSHDVVDLTAKSVRQLTERLVRQADAWIYTADKNLSPFTPYGIDAERFFKLNNAMPLDERGHPKTRGELGISDDAVVFTFVARGVERKGWRAVVMAFQSLLERRRDANAHLLLVGTGEKELEAKKMVNETDPIKFLGFDSHVNGLYQMSDCAVVPSRFPGESNPLCIVQAIQEGLPILATDIGEIRNMLTLNGQIHGVVFQPQRDTRLFAEDLSNKMEMFLDLNFRTEFHSKTLLLQPKFELAEMIEQYETIYEHALTNRIEVP